MQYAFSNFKSYSVFEDSFVDQNKIEFSSNKKRQIEFSISILKTRVAQDQTLV